jgi:hypothetical protein
MVAIGFKKQFAGEVEARRKKQSIRAKNRFRVGQRLQLYTGMRTNQCRKLSADDPVITIVESVVIDEDFISVGGRRFDHVERQLMAVADGFPDWAAFEAFFKNSEQGLPFHGYLVRWDWQP